MPIEKNIRLLLFLAGAALLNACSSSGRIENLSYYFRADAKSRELLVSLPAGFRDELHSRNEKDIVTRTFRYADGERFFIACKDKTSAEEVQPLADSDALKTLRDSIGEEGSGLNANGTHWARHLRDGFMIGYDSVQTKKLELYDQALHSARIAH